MRYLIGSDFHGNLKALEEAEKIGKRFGVDKCISLGDNLLYGLSSIENECLDFLRTRDWMLVEGNHEYWARAIYNLHPENKKISARNIQMMEAMPTSYVLENLYLISHMGVFRDKETEIGNTNSFGHTKIITKDDAKSEFECVKQKKPLIFGQFVGHYHGSKLFFINPNGKVESRKPVGEHPLTQRFIATPGSCIAENPDKKVIIFDSGIKEIEFIPIK